jgi:glycosyltransferase involved in cell wall biosynthesis
VNLELSVIIPCHNEAATLPHQLDALARQSWDGTWEVIVVDNASTDDTADTARAHVGLSGRLRVVDARASKGVPYARRAGVEASSARSVAFCDGDDIVEEGWLAALGTALRDQPIVTGETNVDVINPPGLARSRGTRKPGAPPLFAGVVFTRGNNHGMWRSVWDELDGFDENFRGLEDVEFGLRAHAAGYRVHFEPAAIVHYRYRDEWRALWRQAKFYGGSVPRLARRAEELGLTPPRRLAGWRSWAWLVINTPLLVRRSIRPRWVWTLGTRLGVLRGAIAARRLQI